MKKQKSHSRVVTTFALALVLFASWFALPARYQQLLEPTALAAPKTFVVNVNGDGTDANPGNGICETSTAGNCSLRAAIEEANANSGTDTINFNIPGAGGHTISPSPGLPAITDPVVINGYSQPGASANTLSNGGDDAVLLIQLQGASGFGGLSVFAGNSTIKGLVINSFANGTAIYLHTGGGNKIQGNFIGTNRAGTAALPNNYGVDVDTSDANTIGGLAAADRNVISGNQVAVIISAGTGNLVQNNFIGMNADGDAALPNTPTCDCGAVRVVSFADNTTIGGLGQAGNIISGNSKHGVEVGINGGIIVPTRTKVQNNFIGTTGIFENPLGNGGSGILINGTTDTTIGGPDAGNTIAYNGANGVTVIIGVYNSILSNRIFSNGSLGIDLNNNDGVTPNDLGDTDAQQNFPVISSFTKSGDAALFHATLNSKHSTSYKVEFFSNQSCDPSGNGEGQTLIDSIDTTTDTTGNVSIFAAVPMSILSGNFITATATDSNTNNSSEFSQCTQLSTPLPVVTFGQSTYSTFEDCTAVTITVARSGDTSTASSVVYSTLPGTASERSDFDTAAGRITFAPGETAKSFDVLITEDSYVEGTESFAVTIGTPSGATLGSPATATVQIFDDPPEPSTNPIDVADDFVCQHYHDFLNREDDSAGLAFWTNNITSCGADAACIHTKRVDTSAAFFLSFEFQETGGFVIRVQRVAFGKKSGDAATRISYNQFIRDARQVGDGVVVGQPGFDVRIAANEQTYATQLVTSAAFINTYPLAQTADQYVDALFASAGVTPINTERQDAINAFGAGGTAGRTAALRSVSDSNSVGVAEFSPTFVLMQYFGYLRRNPTDAPDNNDSGYQFWLTKLNNFNGDFRRAEMVKAFITSGEYRSRFGTP